MEVQSPSRSVPARLQRLLPVAIAALIAVLALLVPTQRVSAANCTWDGATANWSETAHWSCGQEPANNDNVYINSGTVTLTTDPSGTLTILSLGGGTLDGNTHTLSTKALAWSAGTITSSAPSFTLSVTESLSVTTSSAKSLTNTLLGITLTTNGTYTWDTVAHTVSLTGSTLRLAANSTSTTYTIPASFNLDTSTFEVDKGRFTLTGNYARTGSSTATVHIGNGTDAPTVTIQNGTYNLTNGASVFQSGTTTFATAGTLTSLGTATVSGGTVTLNSADSPAIADLTVSAGTLNGSDAVSVTSLTLNGTGTFGPTGTVSVTTLTMSGGTFSGASNTVSVTNLDWTGGYFNASGTLPVTVTHLSYSATANRGLTNTNMIVSGITSWDSGATGTLSLTTSQLTFADGSASLILPTAFSVGLGSTLTCERGTLTLAGAISGSGSLRVGAASYTPTITISASYSIAATTFITGTTTFASTSTLTSLSSFTLSGGDAALTSGETVTLPTLTINGGSLSGSDALSITTLNLNGGALAGSNNTITVTSSLAWSGGNINGSGGTLTLNASSLAFSSTASRSMTATVLTVSAISSWGGDATVDLSLANSSLALSTTDSPGTSIPTSFTLHSGGLLELADGTFYLSGNIGVGGSSDAGAFQVGAASGSPAAFLVTSGTSAFNLAGGSTTISRGAVNFDSSITLTSLGVVSISGGTATLASGESQTVSSLTLSGTGTLAGTDPLTIANLTMSGGTFSETGTTTVTGTLDWSGGNFSVASGRIAPLVSSLNYSAAAGSSLTNTDLTIGEISFWNPSDTGTLSLNNSSLSLSTSSGRTLPTSFTLDSTSTLQLKNGSFDLTGAISGSLSSGAGTLRVGDGTLNPSARFGSNTFNLTGGNTVFSSGAGIFESTETVTSLGSVTISGGVLRLDSSGPASIASLDWTAGMIDSASVTTPITVPSMTLSGGGTRTLRTRGLDVAASSWSGSVPFGLSNGAALTLNDGAVFTSGSAVTFSGGGTVGVSSLVAASGSTVNVNSGVTLQWAGGTWSSGSTDQGGMLSVNSGATLSAPSTDTYTLQRVTLDLDAATTPLLPYAWPQNFALDAGGELSLAHCAYSQFTNLTVSGGAISGGTVVLANNLTVNSGVFFNAADLQPASMTWNAGEISSTGSGTVTIPLTGSLALATGGAKTLSGGSFTVNGSTNWSGNGSLALVGATLNLNSADPISIIGPISADSSSAVSINSAGGVTLASGAAFTGQAVVTVSGLLTLISGSTVTADRLVIGGGILWGTDAVSVTTVDWNNGSIGQSGYLDTAHLNLTMGSAILNGRTLRVSETFTRDSANNYFSLLNGARLEMNLGPTNTAAFNILALNEGSSLGGDSPITAAMLAWYGGTIDATGTGRVSIAPDVLRLDCPGPWVLQNRVLTANTIQWIGPTCTPPNPTFTLTNSSFVIQGGGTFTPPLVLDNGTLDFQAGSSNLTVEGGISGSGDVTFALGASTTATIQGAYSLATGSTTTVNQGTMSFATTSASLGTLTVNGGAITFNSPQTVTLDGLAINGGTVNFNSGHPITLTDLTLTSGSLGGSDNVVISGELDWSGGSLNGASGSTISAGSLRYTNPTATTLTNRTLTAAAITAWSGGAMTLDGSSLVLTGGASSDTIIDGAITVGTGANLSLQGGRFQFNGLISGAGTVFVGYTSSAAVDFPSYAITGWSRFMRGTVTFGASTSTPALGDLVLSGATVQLASNQQATASYVDWSGGSLEGTASPVPHLTSGGLNVNPGSAMTLQRLYLLVQGTVGWSSSAGLMTIQPDGTLDLSHASPTTDQVRGDLTLAGGALTGSDPLVFSKTLTWSSGTISGVGSRPSIQVATLTINGNGPWTLDNRRLTTTNAVTWSGDPLGTLTVDNGDLVVTGGSSTSPTGPIVLANNGILEFDGGSFAITTSLTGNGSVVFGPTSAANATFSGSYVFDLGTTSGATTITSGAVIFGNTSPSAVNFGSQLNLAGGSLDSGIAINVTDFNWSGGNLTVNGGNSLNAANLNYSSNAARSLGGGTVAVGTAVNWPATAAGILTISNSGVLSLAGDPAVTALLGNLSLQTGTLACSVPVQIMSSRTLNWQAGTISGGQPVSIPSGASLAISTSGSRILDQSPLNIGGSLSWINGGSLQLDRGASINNLTGGVMTLNGTADVSIEPLTASSTGTFTNSGRLNVNMGSTYVAKIDLPFSTPGSIYLNTGTLQVDHDVDGQTTGVLNIANNTALTGMGNITGMGNVVWSGGTITGTASSGTSPSLETARFTGANNLTLDTRNITVETTLGWAGNGTVTFVNNPLIEIKGTGSITHNITFTGPGTFQVDQGLTQIGAQIYQNEAQFAWGGGTLGYGRITIQSGSPSGKMNVFSGAGGWAFDAAHIRVFGTATWPASGLIEIGNDGLLELSTISGTSALPDLQLDPNSDLCGADVATVETLTWDGGANISGTSSTNPPLLTVNNLKLVKSTPGSAVERDLINRTIAANHITGWSDEAGDSFYLDHGILALSVGSTDTITILSNFGMHNSAGALELIDGGFVMNGGITSTNTTDGGGLQVGSTSTSPTVTFAGSYLLKNPTFQGGTATFQSGATISIPNQAGIFGGTLNLQTGSAVTFNTLNLSAGTLGGTDQVNVNTQLNWTGGTIAGSPDMTIATLNVSGSGPWGLNTRNLNAASTTWAGSGSLNFSGGATLAFTGTTSISGATSATGSGTLSLTTASLASGTTIDVDGGAALRWERGTLTGGTLTVKSGGLLTFGAGPWSLVSTLVVNGTPAWPAAAPLTVTAGGILDVTTGSAQTVPLLTIAGGTFQGSDDVTIGGTTIPTLTWSSGTIGGTGSLTIPDTSKLELSGSGARILDQRHLIMVGTFNWTDPGTLFLNNKAIFENQGVMNIQTSSNTTFRTNTITGDLPGKIVNSGTLNQSGSGTTEIDVAFNGGGALYVTNGILTLNPPSDSLLNGQIFVQGGKLNFNSGKITLGNFSKINGDNTGEVVLGSTISASRVFINGIYDFQGTTRLLNSSSLSFTAASHAYELSGVVITGTSTLNLNTGVTGDGINITKLDLQGGTLAGADPVTVSGQLDWSGGTLGGDSGTTLTLPSGAQMNYLGSDGHTLNSRVLNLNGTTLWSGYGLLTFKGSAALNNGLSATMTIQQPVPSYMMLATATATVFTNSGTLVIHNPAGAICTIGVPTANTGTIDLQSGTFKIDREFTQTAGLFKMTDGDLVVSTQSTGQTLHLAGGRFQALGTSTITGNLSNNGAQVDLGDSSPARTAGHLTIKGNFSQGSGGTLVLYLPDGASRDLIDVDGTAALAGTLTMAPDYSPPNGDVMPVMTYKKVSGSFTRLVGSVLSSGLYLLPDYALSTVLNLKVTDTPSNLSIDIDDGATTVTPGTVLTYTITVTNNDSKQLVTGANVTAEVPTGIDVLSVTWTCDDTSACQIPAYGTKTVSQVLTLAPSAVVTITIKATVAADASGTIAYAARVDTGVTVTDTDVNTVQTGTPTQTGIYLPLIVR